MAITNINGIPFLWDEEDDGKLLGSLFPQGLSKPSVANALHGNPNAKFPQFPTAIEWSSNNLSDLLNYYYYNAPTKEVTKNLNIYYFDSAANTTNTILPQNSRLNGNTSNVYAPDPNENNQDAWDILINIYDVIINVYKPDYGVNEVKPIHFLDVNNNDKYDSGDTKLLDVKILFSYDGAALLKQWNSLKNVGENDLVLFIELDPLTSDIFSDTVLLARGGENVMKYINSVGKFKSYLQDRFSFKVSEKELEELFKSTQKTDNFFIIQWFVNKYNKAKDYVKDKIDDLEDWVKSGFWETIGNFIDNTLRIDNETWDTNNEKNTIHKLIEILNSQKKKLVDLKDQPITFKAKVGSLPITVKLDTIPQRAKNIITSYIEFLDQTIDFIKNANIVVAFACGFWNGFVDMLTSICYLISLLYEARDAFNEYNKDKEYYNTLLSEYLDNFVQSVIYLNWFKVAKYAYEKVGDIKEYLSKVNFTADEIAYYTGYTISLFVETTFLPLQLARLTKLKSLENIILKIQSVINKIAAPIERVTENLLSLFFRTIEAFLKALQRGADEVIKLVDELIESLKKSVDEAIKNAQIEINKFITLLPSRIGKFINLLTKEFPTIQKKIVDGLLIIEFKGTILAKIDPKGIIVEIKFFRELENYVYFTELKNVRIKLETVDDTGKKIIKKYEDTIEVMRKGDDVSFRAKFEEGKIRDAEYINHTFIKSNSAPPFAIKPKSKNKVIDTILKENDEFYIVEFENRSLQRDIPGNWSSNFKVKNIEELREKLQVLKAWKDEAKGTLVVRKYKVKANQEILAREGFVGHLETGISTGPKQWEFIDGWSNDFGNIIDKIEEKIIL